jgi:hypothetical protein
LQLNQKNKSLEAVLGKSRNKWVISFIVIS